MGPTKKIRVKICCIRSIQEANLAIYHGASALGFVSEMPSGHSIITEEQIKQIVAIVPPSVSSFLLTSKQDSASIIAQQRRCGVNTIQICDRLKLQSYQYLRDAMPGIALVQVVHIIGTESIDYALTIEPWVNALILDSGNPFIPKKILGGTGRTHDWTISRKIRELVNIPIFLAGGITQKNVVEAIRKVEPFGIDICSGVRTSDTLDEGKLKFISYL